MFGVYVAELMNQLGLALGTKPLNPTLLDPFQILLLIAFLIPLASIGILLFFRRIRSRGDAHSQRL